MDTTATTTVTLPAYEIGESISLTTYLDHVGRIQALAQRLPYGTSHRRAVVLSLADMSTFASRNQRYSAAHALLMAEMLARKGHA